MQSGLLLVALTLAGSFADEQSRAPRVIAARAARAAAVRQLFAKAELSYPPGAVYLRAFKQEGELELWAADKRQQPLKLVKTYRICARSGTLGPKRARGDLQVPEGFYYIERFQPASNFHLSLGLDYPNEADRLRERQNGRQNLGGDIFIHGNCVTIGCIPIEDEPIEELYLAMVDARLAGVTRLPVHIFPLRMTEAGMKRLAEEAGDDAALLKFWRSLAPAYAAFDKDHRVPKMVARAAAGYQLVP